MTKEKSGTHCDGGILLFVMSKISFCHKMLTSRLRGDIDKTRILRFKVPIR